MFIMELKQLLAVPRTYLFNLHRSHGASSNADVERADKQRIEDHPLGYPRFAALVGSHQSFQVCRRFSNLRARLLLLKQDKLSQLEEKLKIIDENESKRIFLGSRRRDTNEERESILHQIDNALMDYDAMIQRTHQIFSLVNASPQAISNLRAWLNGNACISKAETAYLSQDSDLLGMVTSNDEALTWLNEWVQLTLIRIWKGLRKGSPFNDISRDPNVHITTSTVIKSTSRGLIAIFVVVLLLAPVIVCTAVKTMTARLIIVVLASIVFISIVSGLGKARSIEVLVAGSTYATVLVVFVSGTSYLSSGNQSAVS